MMKTPLASRHTGGWTLTELMIVLMIISIMAMFVSASYDVLRAKVRCSKVKADMTNIAKASYVDYSNNLGVWDIAPNPWTPPPSIMASGTMTAWPEAPCPGWYYSFDNGAIFGLNVVRVSLRKPDESALWSYCVNTYGGGDCDAMDIYSSAPTIEVNTDAANRLYCTE